MSGSTPACSQANSFPVRPKPVKEHIVNNEEILIGRNDDDGYYFKFGIYRVGNSTVPVCYRLAVRD